MGQAASMCRFRGCRYKKSKANKTQQQQQQQQHEVLQQLNSSSSSIISTATSPRIQVPVAADAAPLTPPESPAGLHLRSIEEPTAQLFSLNSNPHSYSSTSSYNNNNPNSSCGKMTVELGGTGYGSEHNLLLSSRTGVPLAVYQNHHQQQFHQQQQQQQQQQQYQPQPQQQQQLQHHHHQQQQHQSQLQHYTTNSHHNHYYQHQNSSSSSPLSLNPLASPQRQYDPEYARMESWMDENQEFVQDYFIRKATRQVVDAWLVSHATTAGNDISNTSPTHPNGQNCSSRGGSGATTPVRKISAHEFERGGLLKPIVNTIDGTPTFLSIGTQNDCSNNTSTSSSNGSVSGSGGGGGVGVGGVGAGVGVGNIGGSFGTYSVANNAQYHHNNHHHYNNQQTGSGTHAHHYHNHYRPQRLSRNELKQLDEKELIFELVKDICNELEVRTLCHKILQNVSILLNADRGSLFLVQGRCGSGSGGLKKCLVSKLFDVCPRSTVEEMEQQNEVQIAWGTGIAGHVAESGEPVNIPDAYQDDRFNCEIDTLTGYRTKALLCMPIKDSSGDVIGVAQVINKLNGEHFSETDEKVFASYLQFCGIGLRNAQLYEKSQLEVKRNQVLLDLARMIFEEQSTIEHMVFRILTHMQSLIQCQRVQILLVHEASKGSFSRVFDFEANDLSEEASTNRTSPFESRFPINVGITGHVATTGETVNIPNAYADDRFDPSVDENTNFQHKSILCMAIKNSLGQIIGVIQLINKFDNLNFTKNDENFVEAFAIFCGMGIHNTHMYEKAIVAMAKQSVTLEVLSYHASASIDEAHRLSRLKVPSAAHFFLHDFRFDDIHFEDDDTLKACLRMFLDLDLVERFHIDYEVLCRWLLSVKKNYRNVTYHNWRHAFNVAQMMFAILTTTQWWKIFGEIECLALIIACLCHDLDHRGTNNSFQIKASSPLAQLYSTSTMEHHHFDQCLMILNSPGNQILANLSSEDYCRVIKVLEDAILSTDLAVYFRKRGTFLQSVKEHTMSYWLDEEPRSLLRAMIMTVCDLSAITKPWEIEKRVADLVSSEFFEQGDMEKEELNITPIDIMNREKKDELPMMQVGFIDSICLPIYEAFAQLSDKLEPLVEGVRENRQHWMALAEGIETKQNEKSNDMVRHKNKHNRISKNLADTNPDVLLQTPNSDLNNEMQNENKNDANVKQSQCEENNADDEETGIEADDDDSETELLQEHSTVCCSSGSSRLSTPPPTGEEDNSNNSPKNGPLSETQAQMIAAHVDSLKLKALGQRSSSNYTSCRNCECMRVRKTSSLKGENEMICWNGGSSSSKSYSKSNPSMANCGTAGGHKHQHTQHYHHHHHQNSSSTSTISSDQTHPKSNHNHSHHHQFHSQHHHHHNHHLHHHHHQSSISVSSSTGAGGGALTTAGTGSDISNQSNLSESDKIPKIVGKLGNLDTNLHHITSTSNGCSAYAVIPNGHFNYLPNNVLSRHHSPANGSATLTTNFCSNTNTNTTAPITATATAAITPAPAPVSTLTPTSPTPTPPIMTVTSQSITTTPLQMSSICDK